MKIAKKLLFMSSFIMCFLVNNFTVKAEWGSNITSMEKEGCKSITVDTIYNLSPDGKELQYKKNKLEGKVGENKCNFDQIQISLSGIILSGNIEYEEESRVVPFRLTGQLKNGIEYDVKDVILDCKDEYNNFEIAYIAVVPNCKNLFNDTKVVGKNTFVMYMLEKDTRNYLCLEDVNTQLVDIQYLFQNIDKMAAVEKDVLLWRTKYMKIVDEEQSEITSESKEELNKNKYYHSGTKRKMRTFPKKNTYRFRGDDNINVSERGSFIC